MVLKGAKKCRLRNQGGGDEDRAQKGVQELGMRWARLQMMKSQKEEIERGEDAKVFLRWRTVKLKRMSPMESWSGSRRMSSASSTRRTRQRPSTSSRKFMDLFEP